MNPFGTRGRAEELARLLEGAVPALAGPFSGTTSGALSAPSLVARLRAAGEALAPASTPRPEFRAALRTRLVAVATVQAAAAATVTAAPSRSAARSRPQPLAVAWPSGRRTTRGAGVAAGAMASVVAVTGVAVAGSQSLPGDPFYGVKRGVEALQLRTADGAVEKGNLHLDFAATRLREVRGLTLGRDAARTSAQPPALAAGVDGAVLAAGAAPLADGEALGGSVAARVKETLADMDAETRKGSALLTRAFRASQQPEPLRALARFATRQSDGLEELLPELPGPARERARASLALLTAVDEQAEELLDLGTCGPACDPRTSAPAPGAAPSGAPTAPGGDAPCGCPTTSGPAPQAGTPQPSPRPQPSSAPPAARPSASPQPSAAPTETPRSGSGGPLPVPLPSSPLPLPSPPALPEPIASILPTLGPLQPLVDPLLPGLLAEPSPTPSPAPLPRPLG